MNARMRRLFLIGIPYLWLLIFFFAPFLIVLKISLSDTTIAQPPYVPTFDLADGWAGIRDFVSGLDFESFSYILDDALYVKAFFSSLKIALLSTVLALVVAFPLAYGMARAPQKWRAILLTLVILPFWTSFLIRVYAWIGILRSEGLLNQFLQATGLISEPLQIINTPTAVYIGIVYSYLPFMVLPIYSTLEKMDESLLEAAIDLGCTPRHRVLADNIAAGMPGVIAGCFLVFIPAMGEFVIPDLLGGSSTLMMGKTLWTEFFSNRDWPVACAVAIVLLAALVVPILIFQRQAERQQEAIKMTRPLHLVQRHCADTRLRLPLCADPAAGHLFVQRIAPCHGVGRVLDQMVRRTDARQGHARRRLGDAAGGAFIRDAGDRARHHGRLCAGARRPLYRPHPVFRHDLRAAGDAGSHHRPVVAVAVHRARHRARHSSPSCWRTSTFAMCYVAVVVSSRLVSFDRSLEEAALDLGCPPLDAFFR